VCSSSFLGFFTSSRVNCRGAKLIRVEGFFLFVCAYSRSVTVSVLCTCEVPVSSNF